MYMLYIIYGTPFSSLFELSQVRNVNNLPSYRALFCYCFNICVEMLYAISLCNKRNIFKFKPFCTGKERKYF